MKKIVLSLSIVAAAAAIVIGGTTAYFSDTETSTGNTFTAGILDLIIDIDGVEYNPLNGPIFSYPDIKPGDNGEETVSLHVQNNACGFVEFNLTEDKDNSCTEPEIGAEPNCNPTDPGELNDNLEFTLWLDQGIIPGFQGKDEDKEEGDNIWQEQYEPIATKGTLTSDKSYAFGGIPANQIQYYGIAWELPATVGNEAQSDSFKADMIIKAEQYRNQYGPDQNFPQGCPIGEVQRPS